MLAFYQFVNMVTIIDTIIFAKFKMKMFGCYNRNWKIYSFPNNNNNYVKTLTLYGFIFSRKGQDLGGAD